MVAKKKDIQQIQKAYEGRKAYFGELHDHACTGGTSDGKRPLSHWVGALEALKMDFAAIVDHRQVRHMYLPEWKDGLFICGTEPATKITDSGQPDIWIHYNMLTPTVADLENVLAAFPEFDFTGGREGHFGYPHFSRQRFCELIDAVKACGGFFVIPHPRQLLESGDPLDYGFGPLDYWFEDEVGLEVFYGFDPKAFSGDTANNYTLWTELLRRGKRIWATAGGDGHACCSDLALTTMYASEKSSAGYFAQLRKGDFVCGSVGIQMCVDDVTMGGHCGFEGKRLVIRIADFHRSVACEQHPYRVVLVADEQVVFSSEVSCMEPVYFAENLNSKFHYYRVEVFDALCDKRIAIGNPIWNDSVSES